MNTEFELFERDEVIFSDVESIADSVEIEPYVSYDDEMNEFFDKENDWLVGNDVTEEDFIYSNNICEEDLPDYVPDDVIIDNLTPEMVRVVNRLYPGDVPEAITYV